MWGIIATWAMAFDGILKGKNVLSKGLSCFDAVERTINVVENNSDFKSVGYGGLPNENGIVELDGAFMDGDTFSIGAVGGIRNFKNPVSIARKLSFEKYNNFLVGIGAEQYARDNGFEEQDILLQRSKEIWEEKKEKINKQKLKAYSGHDTIGVVGIDSLGKMCAATSTSGLFMKKRGRVGDSPLCGCGLYVDSEIGGAVATGVGEDIMKGCISYEIVRNMREGLTPQESADKSVNYLTQVLIDKGKEARDISVVCMNNRGEWGVSTNIKEFSFVVAAQNLNPKIYLAEKIKGKTKYTEATKKWINNYMKKELK